MAPSVPSTRARTLLAGLVRNLSFFSPASLNRCTTLSVVTAARRALFGEQHMAVTLHIFRSAGIRGCSCRSFMAATGAGRRGELAGCKAPREHPLGWTPARVEQKGRRAYWVAPLPRVGSRCAEMWAVAGFKRPPSPARRPARNHPHARLAPPNSSPWLLQRRVGADWAAPPASRGGRRPPAPAPPASAPHADFARPDVPTAACERPRATACAGPHPLTP